MGALPRVVMTGMCRHWCVFVSHYKLLLRCIRDKYVIYLLAIHHTPGHILGLLLVLPSLYFWMGFNNR